MYSVQPVCEMGISAAKSLAIGADYIATGHYAKIVQLENGRYTLIRSDAKGKDQTYALYNLTQNQLSHTLFPIGSYEKPQIRAIAEKAGLQVAHKPDSQEICFVPDNDYADFIEHETNEVEKPGNFVSTSGEILGTHKGIGHYTIGQRKGLGIAFGEPMFVVEICPETNEVVLGKNDEVFTDWLKANQVNHMAVDHFEVGQKVTARIRYNHGGAKAVISEVTEDSFLLHLKNLSGQLHRDRPLFYTMVIMCLAAERFAAKKKKISTIHHQLSEFDLSDRWEL